MGTGKVMGLAWAPSAAQAVLEGCGAGREEITEG